MGGSSRSRVRCRPCPSMTCQNWKTVHPKMTAQAETCRGLLPVKGMNMTGKTGNRDEWGLRQREERRKQPSPPFSHLTFVPEIPKVTNEGKGSKGRRTREVSEDVHALSIRFPHYHFIPLFIPFSFLYPVYLSGLVNIGSSARLAKPSNGDC